MKLTDLKEKAVAKVMAYRLALTTLMLSGLVSIVSADLNSSVSPIILEVTKLFVPLLAVVVGAVPIIVTIAVIGFILGLLALILTKIKV